MKRGKAGVIFLVVVLAVVILSGAKNLYSAVSWTETTRTDWNGGFIWVNKHFPI